MERLILAHILEWYEGGGETILFPEPYDAELLREVVKAMCLQLPKKD